MVSVVSKIQKINATDFKAKCLDILDRIGDGELSKVIITKRGRVVACLVPVESQPVASLHGFMRGTVTVPADFDLTAPVADEGLSVEDESLRG
jgi:prevent-host-death family protein